MNQSIRDYFLKIDDFRQPRKCTSRLADILLIGLCTYLSNGQDYEDMVLFAQTSGYLLPQLIDLSSGIPAHDTFNRVFQILDPDVLRKCLGQHGKALLYVLADKQIGLDGKKLTGVSPHSKGTDGLYIVNAWVSENRLCIGQQGVDAKSNEIDVLVPLIKNIDMTDEPWEYARDRFEQRRCRILPAWLSTDKRFIDHWPGLQTLLRLKPSAQLVGIPVERYGIISATRMGLIFCITAT